MNEEDIIINNNPGAHPKTIILIPAYEPEAAFIDYAHRLSGAVDCIVVVDDGSGEKYDDIFNGLTKIPELHLIRFPQNRGKGAALREGYAYCVNNFSEHDYVVTADCDGQHRIEDIFSVREGLSHHPEAMIIGSRDFSLPNVPKRSKAGNAQMRLLLHILYGINVYDTQSGLRGVTVKTAEKLMHVSGNRFEYETNTLIFAARNSIPLVERRIETVYPEVPEEHTSHFRSFRDSMRVMGVVFRSIFFFAFSGLAAGVVDLGVFSLFALVIFDAHSAVGTMWATVIARVLSSIVNYGLNRKMVFRDGNKTSVIKYYTLWGVQLAASWGNVQLFWYVIGLPKVPVKAIGDLILSFLSYQIQRTWVFGQKKKKSPRFYGPFAGVALFFGRIFSKKYRFVGEVSAEPCIYVCRHLNMHGPYTIMKWMPIQVHPLVLSVFFSAEGTYKQFVDFTFSKKTPGKHHAVKLRAKLSSAAVAAAVRSVRAVPVYRNSCRSITTLREGLACLQKGESIVVFADKDYSGSYATWSDIYTGFIYIGEMYHRATGGEVQFVPLVIDDAAHTISALDPCVMNNRKSEMEGVAEYIAASINVVPRDTLKERETGEEEGGSAIL